VSHVCQWCQWCVWCVCFDFNTLQPAELLKLQKSCLPVCTARKKYNCTSVWAQCAGAFKCVYIYVQLPPCVFMCVCVCVLYAMYVWVRMEDTLHVHRQ